MEDRVGQLFASFENIQQLVVAQSNTFARVMRESSDVDDTLTHIFEALRQKAALLWQKSIPAQRQKGDDEEDHFDRGYNGCFRIEVDCTYEQFRRLCRLLRSTISGAWFHPPYGKAQFDENGNTDSEIQFQLLVDLARLLGITRTKDLLTMLRRGRGNCRDKSSEVAVRLLGTFFINDEAENSPAAILVGQTLHVGCLENRVTALYRESREFDMRLMSYRHPLR